MPRQRLVQVRALASDSQIPGCCSLEMSRGHCAPSWAALSSMQKRSRLRMANVARFVTLLTPASILTFNWMEAGLPRCPADSVQQRQRSRSKAINASCTACYHASLWSLLPELPEPLHTGTSADFRCFDSPFCSPWDVY